MSFKEIKYKSALGKRQYKKYSIDQSLLYKVGSHKRLSTVLGFEFSLIKRLLASRENYKVFDLEEKTCQYTGKVTKARKVQEPKKELRAVHERIKKLLHHVELPDYAHAAIKGRSYRSNAAVHLHADTVATLDIKRFYPHTLKIHVYGFFRDKLQCAPDISRSLASLVSYGNGLPTGSPLSPLMSLFVNKPLFDRLDAYAKANNLTFTCYVDDITFSGRELPKDLKWQVARMVRVFRHYLADEKVRIYRSGVPKHITGVIIDEGRIKVPSSRFKKVRAMHDHYISSPDPREKLKIMRGIAGLLGEAAFLDSRFGAMAQSAYDELKRAELAVDYL